MEKELNERVFDLHWKGLMSYEDLTREDKRRFKKEYNAEEFHKALVAAYNLGIEIASNGAQTKSYYNDVYEEWMEVVDKKSILDLQLDEE